jgi:adenylate kinase
MNPTARAKALLLLGPTGSGKSPLGEYLASEGFCGRPCRHFDFGSHLRQVSVGQDYGLSEPEQDTVRTALADGVLLEPAQFGIAVKVLQHFLAMCQGEPAPLVVLNGLPRHAQQAQGLETVLDVRGVVALQCEVATVLERIRLNSGGDRAGRIDDDHGLIRRKLAIYRARTEPLIEHYRTKGVSVCAVDVSVFARPAEIVKKIAQDLQI